MQDPQKDLTGKRFGRLQVLWAAGRRERNRVYWTCQCDDGNVSFVRTAQLINGGTRSCGCLQREAVTALCKARQTTHGHYHTPEHVAYVAAKGRCTNPKNRAYKNYGGRGIKFLFTSFLQFFAELGPRPSPAHSLDRKNNDGHYEPGNLRWGTLLQQRRNRRPYKTNRN